MIAPNASRPAVSGPHRVYVTRAPLGADVDVSHFFGSLLRQLAEDFTTDPEGVASALHRIAEHDQDAEDEVLQRIGGGQLRLYGEQVHNLARALLTTLPTHARGRAR